MSSRSLREGEGDSGIGKSGGLTMDDERDWAEMGQRGRGRLFTLDARLWDSFIASWALDATWTVPSGSLSLLALEM